MLVVYYGCSPNDQNAGSATREHQLRQQAQRLSNWEQELKVKEKELLAREKRLDSIRVTMDTVSVFNANIVGDWTITMHCTETNCAGYVIGDSKTEQWNISYQDTKVLVKASAAKKFIRSYSGIFKGNTLQLNAQPAPDAQTTVEVTLNVNKDNVNLMTGQRVINKVNTCKTVFAVNAEKLN